MPVSMIVPCFWKENKAYDMCHLCGESRYKFVIGKGKKIPQKVLRYFPLKPRQRLFVSRYMTKDMKWHKEKHVIKEGVLRHSADCEAWKDFDKSFPWFAQDPHNVRLGLASDGSNPIANMYNSYNMWHVMLMPYNLPP